MKKATVLFLSTWISTAALAAQPTELKETRKLEFLRSAFAELCHAGSDNLDCWVAAYNLQPSKRGWADAVRKLLLSMEYVDEVSADYVDEQGNALFHAVRMVGDAAGVGSDEDDAFDAYETVYERLQNDVADESRVIAVAGSVGGEFDLDHRYFAVLDKKNRQVLVISAGYSE